MNKICKIIDFSELSWAKTAKFLSLMNKICFLQNFKGCLAHFRSFRHWKSWVWVPSKKQIGDCFKERCASMWRTRNRKNAVVFLSKIIADVATFKKPETCFALHDEWPMGPFFKTSHIHWPLQKWYHLNNSLDKITGTISWVLQEGKRYGTAHQHTSHSW